MNRFFSAFVFNVSIVAMLFGVSSFSFFGVERAGLLRAMESACERMATDYVRSHETRTQEFVQRCYDEAPSEVERAMSGEFGLDSRRALIGLLNERLSFFRVSHLAAMAPDETSALWTGEALDTGARARLVDGEVVVMRVLDNSPAARAGVRMGDMVLSVDGIPVADAGDLEYSSGVWEVLKSDETRISVPVEAEVLQDRLTPYWVTSQEVPGVRVLKMPSFLPQAFDGDEWPKVRDQIVAVGARGDKLIVDLRGNPGGSFPAMLRALGALQCDRKAIGWVYRGTPPSAKSANASEFVDALSGDIQIDLLKKHPAIALKPFAGDGCYGGALGVLIDQHTGSVAEIFAQALKERPRTVVAGWRSGGRVVMARWFQLAGLSDNYTISVPVALYRSAKGEELESRGVSPDQLLVDSLKRWRSSRDPWIRDLMIRVVSL